MHLDNLELEQVSGVKYLGSSFTVGLSLKVDVLCMLGKFSAAGLTLKRK